MRGLGGGALVVEGEETFEDLLGSEGLVVDFDGPAIGGEDGFVEGAVGVGEPGGTLVVQIGGCSFSVFFGDVGF